MLIESWVTIWKQRKSLSDWQTATGTSFWDKAKKKLGLYFEILLIKIWGCNLDRTIHWVGIDWGTKLKSQISENHDSILADIWRTIVIYDIFKFLEYEKNFF